MQHASMQEDSRWVVFAALTGNVLVASAKFAAALISQSSAMFTEAVHSSADCVNQVLLLIGTARSRKAADRSHPFGYDGEIYFWAFVVAVMVLLVGGATSIYQGVRELRHPHSIDSPGISLIVLALSAVFESASLVFGYRASRRIVRRHPGDGKPVSIWRFIKLSKDPSMYESLLEDSAALMGIAFATVGVVGSAFFQLLWLDAAASIAIGVLLIATSYVIASATRSLIAGEAAAPALQMDIERALQIAGFWGTCSDVRSLHLGPNTILVTLRVDLQKVEAEAALKNNLRAIALRVKQVDERIRDVFFDVVGTADAS
jgi:cation diffusion facilitator family transporter